MYYIDTPHRRIDTFKFDVEAGSLEGREVFIRFEEGCGNPDGMTVDSEGCVWVALARGGMVRRYSPKGVLDLTLEVPTHKITSCTFGGKDLDVLFVTSACVGLSESELRDEPLAGSVFAYDVGVSGSPASRYAK
jgi:sugar lactone lactonase YvrE